MKVLLSSIGRRGYLVRFFKESLGPGDEVWGGDCSRLASAFHFCDRSLVLPEVTTPDYVDEVADLCRRESIDMLVPLIDPELEALARQRQRFFDAGTMVVVSPPATVDIGCDKYLTYQLGKECGIPVPETVLTVQEAERLLAEGRFTWPLVVKPRRGSASANITFCRSLAELRTAFDSCPLPMIQEFLAGDEYGYDLFGDREYRLISVYCKKKLQMRAGETDKAVSTDDPQLLDLGRRLAQNLQIFGPLDADVKLGPDGPKLLEINPRFGGGYPCSHLCGANFPGKLVAMCRGARLDPDARPGPANVYMFKQDEIIRRDQGMIESIEDRRAAQE